MALSENEKNEVKQKVLLELEHMFTEMSNQYNSVENHDMMLYLMDVEKAIKKALVKDEAISATGS